VKILKGEMELKIYEEAEWRINKSVSTVDGGIKGEREVSSGKL
jgi:hypothetical protein